VLEHERIVQAIKQGNEESFRKIFHAYYEGLCQYAFTLLRDMDDAEDIVQSMFLKIWEKRETLVISHTIKAYLYKAIYHQCMNQFDHRAVRLKFQEKNKADQLSLVQSPDVFPNELEERIIAAINTLPKQCRTIFMMSRYQEMKYAEIAKALDISVNTIENQISKALKILRAYFDNGS
jgi:RNA polymerase sigma-70 factor (ECF subfamily)